jgi:hypothetical protein
MREAGVAVREAGLDPWITAGAAARQAWMADLTDQGVFGKRVRVSKARRKRVRSPDWRIEADRILEHMKRET